MMMEFAQTVLAWAGIALTTFELMAKGLSVDLRLLLQGVALSIYSAFFALVAVQGFSLHEPIGYAVGTGMACMSGLSAWVAMRIWDDWRRRRRKKRKRSRSSLLVRLGRLVVVPR